MVYWKDCTYLCVLRTGQTKPLREIKTQDGQGIVEFGTSLLIGGIGGKVKEWKNEDITREQALR